MPSFPAPDACAIRVLRIPASGPAVAELDLSTLDEEERQRTDAFRRDVDRIRYAAAHVAVRHVLGGYLDMSPAHVRFHREPCPNCGEPHGRPTVTGVPLHHSLSHSGDLVLIAVAGSTVGVDVERWPREEAVTSVGSSLHPTEQAEIEASAPDRRRAVFTRVWCRKEAYLKGLGTGLGRDPALDFVGTPGVGTPSLPDGWTLVDLPVGDGYEAAVAVRTPDLRSWDLADLPFDVVRSALGRQQS